MKFPCPWCEKFRTLRSLAKLRRLFCGEKCYSAYREFLYTTQHGLCALCGIPETIAKLRLDHDHKSGMPRGLIHWKENRGLGWFSDDPEKLRLAAKYLESHKV